MAISRKDEARALDATERALVDQSHHPAVQELSDAELGDLVKRLRERRDKATGEAQRRRREMRGKAPAKGTQPSRDDTGSRQKVAVLAMAMRRVNGEAERRRQMAQSVSLVANARKALAMKQAAEADDEPAFNARTARKGMRLIENDKAESLIRPMERGRLRAQAKASQARRDARPSA